jgi:hypothetical protein
MGLFWVGLMAEQIIFEAFTFRKENQLDIPFWEAFIMSLGFEQNKLQHIFEERQLLEINLAAVDKFNIQANPPYGWILVKVPSLGPLIWRSINASQVPPALRRQIINQIVPLSALPSSRVTREAAGFRQIQHNEVGSIFMTPGKFGTLARGKLLKTTWHHGTYAARTAAIRVQLASQGRSHQENNVFLSQLIETNGVYKRVVCVEGRQYKKTVARSPRSITGDGLAALYTSNRTGSSLEALRNLYLGFDPREGHVTLQIHQSGLQQFDKMNHRYNPDSPSHTNGTYHLTVQLGTKAYPASIIFQPQLGIMKVEDSSRRVNSRYFISCDSDPFYLYDDVLATRIAISPPTDRLIGFNVHSRSPQVIQLQTWSLRLVKPSPPLPLACVRIGTIRISKRPCRPCCLNRSVPSPYRVKSICS